MLRETQKEIEHEAPAEEREKKVENSPIWDAVDLEGAQDRHFERVPLPSGRRVEINVLKGQEGLNVISKDGRVELSVIFEDSGPRLRFEAASVDVNAMNDVNIECENFNVRARKDVSLEGEDASIRATRGDVKVKANDDVTLDGEQVLLNCEGKPDEVPEWMVRELSARLESERIKPMEPRDVDGDPSLLEEYEKQRGE